MIPALQIAEDLYKKNGLVLGKDLHSYLTHGFVFSSPATIMIGRPIIEAESDRWLEPEEYHLADSWFVKMAVGDGALKWFITRMPWHLPKVIWQRGFKGDERLRVFDTDKLIKKILQ